MGDSWTVDIKDFQSLKNAHLQIVPGITTIVGKTNEGKSAVFRAIDAALFNMGDDSMIRGGQRYYGVSIDNGDHKMVFMRDGKGKNEKSAYQFDGGTVQKKVGRGQLPEVAKLFNVRDVRMPNGTKLKINFWYQNDKPFLMDKTSGQLYEFLSLTSCDKYSKVLKTMQADARVLEAEVNNVTAEIDTLKAINNRKNDFIAANSGFDDVYVRVVTLSQKSKKVERLEALLNEIASLSGRVSQLCEEKQKVESELSRLPMDKWSKSYQSILTRGREVQGLVRDVNHYSKLTAQIQDMTVQSQECEKERVRAGAVIDSVKGRLDTLQGSYTDVAEIMGKLITYRDVSERVMRLSQEREKISKLSYPSLEKAKQTLEGIISKAQVVGQVELGLGIVDSLGDSLAQKQQERADLEIRIEQNTKDIESLKSQAGYCPFCGTVFSSMGSNEVLSHLGGN